MLFSSFSSVTYDCIDVKKPLKHISEPHRSTFLYKNEHGHILSHIQSATGIESRTKCLLVICFKEFINKKLTTVLYI